VGRGEEQVVGDVRDMDFLDRPEAVAFKQGGKQFAIVFGEDYLPFAEALRGGGTPARFAQLGLELPVIRHSRWFSNKVKQFTTRDNPFYWPVNFVKDTPSTFIRQWAERGLGFAVKEQWHAYRVAAPDFLSNGPRSKAYREAGGMMPTMGVEDFDSMAQRIQSFLDKGDNASALKEGIERTSDVIENVHRLAVFDLMVESGMSPDRAALAAGEANVFFGKKGELGPLVEAFSPFYQAGVNGTRALTKVMRGRRFKQAATAMVSFGFALDQYNRHVAGEDENGENRWDKIDQWEKDNYFIFLKPGTGSGPKIPKPPGIAWFTNVGMYTSEASYGPSNPRLAASKIGANLLANINPFGNAALGEGTSSQIAPPIVRPALELRDNRDFAGREIVPENKPYRAQKPAHERYRPNVSPVLKDATDWAAESTGGEVDVSPSAIEHLFRNYLPGIFQEIGRSASAVSKGLDPETDVKINDIPLVRRFWHEENPYYTDRKYRENVERILTLRAQHGALIEAGKREEAEAFFKAHPELNAMAKMGGGASLMGKIDSMSEKAGDDDQARWRLKALFNRQVKKWRKE
jgi:hypothetical protein